MIKNIFSIGTPGPCMPHGPLVAALPTIAAVASTAVAAKTLLSKPKTPGLSAEQKAAQARQDELYAAQQAATTRTQQAANTQTAALDKSLANQQAAVIARRRGNAGLSYSGPSTLKTKLGS